jgi:cyanate lyase
MGLSLGLASTISGLMAKFATSLALILLLRRPTTGLTFPAVTRRRGKAIVVVASMALAQGTALLAVGALGTAPVALALGLTELKLSQLVLLAKE